MRSHCSGADSVGSACAPVDRRSIPTANVGPTEIGDTMGAADHVR
jgi:hypothetical protein